MNPGGVVLSRSGAPLVADFSNATGSPIVINSDTGDAYILINETPTLIGSAFTLRGNPVSVFNYMTDAQITDVQARTLLVDVAAARQVGHDAAYTAGRAVYYPAGAYRSNSTVTIGLDQRIFGEGMSNAGLKGTTIVPTGVG